MGFVHSGQVDPVNEFITEEQQQNDAVLVAELLVAVPAIEIEKATNGIDADDPPGPYIPVGDAVIWTYNVTNIGNASGVPQGGGSSIFDTDPSHYFGYPPLELECDVSPNPTQPR